jgi:hypothetical protein
MSRIFIIPYNDENQHKLLNGFSNMAAKVMCNMNKKKQQIKINKQNKSKANRKLNQLYHSSVKENIQIEGITGNKKKIQC